MKKFIAVSFTLKGQTVSEIRPALEKLSEQVGGKAGNAVLVHGFMPREVVKDKGFSTDLVDMLDELFPVQLNCFSFCAGVPQRQMMADIIKQCKGDVYAIGSVVEGVKEEMDLYAAAGLYYSSLPLNWTGDMIARPLTYGEKAVGLTFNPGGLDSVNAIKRTCADAIDELNNQREIAKQEGNGEKIAQFTLAIRDIQSGQMWGVKAATWPY